MKKKGTSVHFCIDNDGTIYQLIDTRHKAYHTGIRDDNNRSIGVEISNAYYTKYQDWYKKKGFGERPIVKNAKVHGQVLDDFTDFYCIQKQAMRALWRAVCEYHDIPLIAYGSEGLEDTSDGGICSHFHLTRRKIDCASLDIPEEMKKEFKKFEVRS